MKCCTAPRMTGNLTTSKTRSTAKMTSLLPNSGLARLTAMTETLQTLQQKMEAAASALDFEEAKRCRDQISLLRSGATAEEAEQADFSGLSRQKPGAMGLGTSQQQVTPPPGWKPPAKPDPMTSGQPARRRRR